MVWWSFLWTLIGGDPFPMPKGVSLPLHRSTPRLMGQVQRIWFEDFEGGAPGWQMDSLWEVGVPSYGPSAPYQGSQVLGTALDTLYPPNAHALALSPVIALPSISSGEHLWLRFAEFLETESGFDLARIEIHTSGGVDTLQVYSGASGTWRVRDISLDAYAGQSVQIGFRFTSDGSVVFAGWYIDAIEILREFPETLSVNIQSVEIQEFPVIYLMLQIDSLGIPPQGLTDQDIQVWEDGLSATGLQLFPPGSGPGISKVDFVFLVDNSGSMSDDIEQVKANIRDFALQLATSGIDFALGVVTFGQMANGGYPIVYNGGALFTDIQAFLQVVNSFGASGGFEPGWDAIVEGLRGIQYRSGALKVLFLITDENVRGSGNQGNATYQDALQALRAHGALLFSMIEQDQTSYEDYGTLAEATGGSVFYVRDPMDQVLEEIAQQVSGFWVLRYETPDPQNIQTWREVVVAVHYAGKTRQDTTTYNPANLITIRPVGLVDSVLTYAIPLAPSTPVTFAFEVQDLLPPFVHQVTLQVERIADTLVQFLSLVPNGGNEWSTSLPGSLLVQPGIRIRVVAQDSLSTQRLPYRGTWSVAVSPSRAPLIFHYSRTSASGDVRIPVVVYTTDLDSFRVFWKKSGDLYVNEAAYPIPPRVSVTVAAESLAVWMGRPFTEALDTLQHHAQHAGLSLQPQDSVYLFFLNLHAVPDTVVTYMYRFRAVDGALASLSPSQGWWTLTLSDSLLPLPEDVYRFAPVLIRERGSREYPAAYEDYINQTRLQYVEGCFPTIHRDTIFPDPPDLERYRNLAESANCCESYYLSLPEVLRPGGTGGFIASKPTVHARLQVQGGKRYIEYLLFFPVNDGPNLHEGDWERLILEFDPADAPQPSRVIFSFHEFYSVKAWEEVPVVGETHPVIGIHRGSHALTLPSPSSSCESGLFNPDWGEETRQAWKGLPGAENLPEIVEIAASVLGDWGEEIGKALYALRYQFPDPIRRFVEKLRDECRFDPGTHAADTLYPESYGVTGSVYILRGMEEIAWSTGNLPFFWGAHWKKWERMASADMVISLWDFALISEGPSLYLVNIGPRGPIRNIPQVASSAVTVQVFIPEGYRWIVPPEGQRTGYQRTWKSVEGLPVVRIRSQIAISDTLRFLASAKRAVPQFRILIVNDEGRREVLYGGIIRGDTVLLPLRFSVVGDRANVVLQSPAGFLEQTMEIYPNPFRLDAHPQGVTIRFRLHEPSEVRVILYDEGGYVIRRWRLTPDNDEVRIVWNGKDHQNQRVPNGVYFVKAYSRSGEKGWGKIIVVRR